MKYIIALLIAIALAGCTTPGELTQARVTIKDGKKSITLESHKDTSIKSFELAPDGTLKLEGYESNANQAAIKASTDQAKIVSDTLGSVMQMFQVLSAMAVQAQSGGMVRPQVPAPQPATVILTNTPVVSTNATRLAPAQ